MPLLVLKCDFLYAIESTISLETNLGSIAKRKKQKYEDLVISLKSESKKVKLVNAVASTLGVFDSSSVDFLEVLKDLEFDQKAGTAQAKR